MNKIFNTKKMFTAIMCGMALFAGSNAYAAEAEVTGKKLNMRVLPDINSQAVRTLSHGYVFNLIDGSEKVVNGEKWAIGIDSDGMKGFVRTAYVKILNNKVDNDALSDNKNVSSDFLKQFNELKQKFAPKTNTKDDVLARSLDVEQNLVFVEGEGLHRVNISLKDLNRITCNGKISDPVYSKDKEIEIVRGGDKDLFVKISPLQVTQNGKTELKFNTYPREVFVECNKMVYSLSLIPQSNLVSQTVVLKNSYADKSESIAFERASDYENLISNLIKAAYNEQAYSGYSVKKGTLNYSFDQLDMRLRYVYTGYNYVVEDWEIKSKVTSSVELEENMFVPVLKNPRAIALTVPRLNYGERGRLLVVRLANGDN